MNNENITSITKASGLKPPTKIARPTSLVSSKTNINSAVDDATFPMSKSKMKNLSDTTLTVDTDSFMVGDRVWAGGTKPGVIAFIGETQFGPGDWAGVALDDPFGKNDGSVAGIRYFQCAPNKGIFTRLSRLSRFPMDNSNLDSTLITPIRKSSISEMSVASSVASSCFKNSVFGSSSNADVNIGDRVIVQSSHGSKVGVLRFYGNTKFEKGIWCGVELSDPLGKNDGSVAGVRYFECAPKHGLFVPVEKVTRSPMSKKYAPGNLTRQGTLESMRSTSTVQTSATSNLKTYKRATTPGSRPSTSFLKPLIASTPRPLFQNQDQQNDKDAYINQLLKERELERIQITKAATQAEEAEQKLSQLQQEYNEILVKHELENENLQKNIEKLVKEKQDLNQQLQKSNKRVEDLQFNYEEESITKSEIQAQNNEYAEKLKSLEKVITSQHPSIEYEGHASLTNSLAGINEVPKDESAELIEARNIIIILNNKNSELENSYKELRENLEKLKLIESGKEDIIASLRKKINQLEQLHVRETTINEPLPTTQSELESLKKEYETLKCSFEQANSKLSELESNIKGRETELTFYKSNLEEKEKELCYVKNMLEFESDENRVKFEEISIKIKDAESKFLEKENEMLSLIKCISRLCSEIDERQNIINRIMLEHEEGLNIETAVIRAIDSRRNETDLLEDVAHLSSQNIKESLQLMSEKIDNNTDHNIMLLKKLETLNEVITRKDNLLDDLNEKNELLRKEFQEAITDKSNEFVELKNKHTELEKTKSDLVEQLKKSDEKLKNIESTKENEKILQNEISEWEMKCNSSKKELIEIKDKLNHQQIEINEEKSNRILLSEQLEISHNECKSLHDKVKSLQQSYFHLYKLNGFICDVKDKKINDDILPISLVEDIDDFHREIVDNNINAYRIEYEKLKNHIDNLNDELKEISEKNAQKIKEVQEEKIRIQDELANAMNFHSNEKSDLENQLKNAAEILNNQLQTKIQTLESQKLASEDEKVKMYEKIASKDEEIQKLKKSNDKMSEEINKLQMDKETLYNELISTKNLIEDYKQELENMKEKMNLLEQKIDSNNELEIKLKELQNEYGEIQKLFNSSTENSKLLHIELEGWLLAKSKVEEENSKLIEQNSLKIGQIDVLKANEIILENELKKTKHENETLKDDLSDVVNSLKNSKIQLDDMDKKFSLLREKLASNSGFEEQLQELQNEYNDIKKLYNDSENDKKVLQKKLNELEMAKTDIENEKNCLSQDIHVHSEEIIAMKKIHDEISKEIERCETEKESLKEELKDAVDSLGISQTQLDDTKKKCLLLQESLNNNLNFEQKYKDLQIEYNSLKTEITCIKENKSKLEIEIKHLENIKLVTEAEKNELNAQIYKFKKDNDNMRKEICELTETINPLQIEIQTLKNLGKEMDEQKMQCSRTINELKSLEIVNKSITAEIETLRSEYNEQKEASIDKISSLESQKLKLQDEIDILSRKCDGCKIHLEEIQMLQNEKDNMLEKCKVLDNLVRENDERLFQLTTKIQTQEKIISEKTIIEGEIRKVLESNVDLKEQSNTTLIDDVSHLKSNCCMLEESVDKMKKEQLNLNEQLTKLEADKDLLESKTNLQKSSEIIDKLTEDNHRQQKEIVENMKIFENVSNELSVLKIEMEKNSCAEINILQTKKENENLKCDIMSLKTELAEMKKSFANIQTELSEKKKEKDKLENNLEELIIEINNLRTSEDEDKNALKGIIDRTKSENTKLQEKISELSEEILKRESEMKIVKAEYMELKKTADVIQTEFFTIKEKLLKSEQDMVLKTTQFKDEKRILEEKNNEMVIEKENYKMKYEGMSEIERELQDVRNQMKHYEKKFKNELSELQVETCDLEKNEQSVEVKSIKANSELVKFKNQLEAKNHKIPKLIQNPLVNNQNGDNLKKGLMSENDETNLILEEKTAAENQVNFLNSVIVDMQQKNSTLSERVKYLENMVPPEALKPKKVIAPRLFCDICDVFDQHETEDCPKQCSTFKCPVLEGRKSPKKKHPPRAYCENCEMFGHDTNECDEQETY